MIRSLLGSDGEVVQVGKDEVCQVLKDIIHGPLEGDSNILMAEWHNLICKCAPWGGESGLVLVVVPYLDLIIPKETIHEGEGLMSAQASTTWSINGVG